MCDDYKCHKGANVWNLCWQRGYIRVVHGEVFQFGPSDVTPPLVKHMRALELFNHWYSKSSSSSNKSAAKVYVLIWCKAVHEMKLAEHNATFQGLVSRASKQCGGTNADDGEDDADDADDADALAAEGADDGDAPAAESASEDEAADAAAADVSAAGA